MKAPPSAPGAGLKADFVSPEIGDGNGDSRTLALATNFGLGRWAPAERGRWGKARGWSGASVDSWLVNGGLVSESIIHCQCVCVCVCERLWEEQ